MAAHPARHRLAFLLALINVIVTEHLGDCDFVKQYTVGFDDLPAAMAEYTPEWAETMTGVPAETIRRIAHEFAAAKRHALAHNGWRTSNFVNSFQTERAIATLNALVGNCSNPNGCLTAESPEASGVRWASRRSRPTRASPRQRLDGVPWKYPFVPLKLGVFQELRDAILTGEPYQAHGWFISRQNPVLSLPDRRRTLEAFAKMDFIVDVDIILNDTAWFSDVVLPEASYLERYDPLAVVEGKVFLRQPVIEPQGEAKSALWIYKQLGERLGLGDYFQYEDEEDYLRQQLAPLGVSLDELKPKGYVELPQDEAGRPTTSSSTRPAARSRSYSETLAQGRLLCPAHLGGAARPARGRVLSADRQGRPAHPVRHAEQPASCTSTRTSRACG